MCFGHLVADVDNMFLSGLSSWQALFELSSGFCRDELHDVIEASLETDPRNPTTCLEDISRGIWNALIQTLELLFLFRVSCRLRKEDGGAGMTR